MIRPSTPADMSAMEEFLTRHPDTSMFLRSNLAQWSARPDDADHCEFWLDMLDGQINGIFGRTANGYGLMQFPNDPPHWSELRSFLTDRRFAGLNGDASQVAMALTGLGFSPLPKALDRIEPLMTLDLGALVVPPAATTALRPPFGADLPLLTDWRAAYMVEIMGFTDIDRARDFAASQVALMVAADTLRLLDGSSGPVAVTAFNARIPGMVQVASVYTPPEHRGQGHARRAVALHLTEVAGSGVTRAVLCAANAPARRAYQAIGFRQTGTYHIVMLAHPATCEAA